MIKPEVLDAMVLAGCSAEQIAAAVKADMSSARSSNAERQARFKSRKKGQCVTSNVTSVTSVTKNVTPSSDKEKSPTPPKEINSTPAKKTLPSEGEKKSTATRLPTGWALPASWGRWALEQGASEVTVRLEADKFRDFWCSKSGRDATKLDWEATWRNWIRNNMGGSQRSQAPPRQQQPTAFQQRHQTAIDAFDRKLGLKPDDEFASDTIDIDAADWRVDREAGPRH